MLALATQTAWSQAASRLEKVELHPQPGEQVEVRLVLDGPAPAPVTFTIDNPARLAVDLPGTAPASIARPHDCTAARVEPGRCASGGDGQPPCGKSARARSSCPSQ